MARLKRTWIPNRFYHVTCRGNRREPLFLETQDFLTFLYILRKTYENTPFELASYCLMTNHFHLLLRTEQQPISKVMSLINKRYANYFNTQYQHTGHVFEKRFYDSLVDSYDGIVDVSHYIHANPVRAKIAEKPEDYPWSSYYFFGKTSPREPDYMNTKVLLDSFNGTASEKRKKYNQSLVDYLNEEMSKV